MKILADESVDRQIVERLRQHYEVYYIAEVSPSVDDTQVLNRANQMQALLITADKDFGELVYRQKLTHYGVVLIRLSGLASTIKADIVLSVILDKERDLVDSFSVINPNNVRIRANARRIPKHDDLVKYYDPSTKKIIDIPKSELAPGLMFVHIQNTGEYCWMDTESLEIPDIPFKHAPFTGKLRDDIKFIQETLFEVAPDSYEKWEEDFRRDQNPQNEIRIWLNACRCYKNYVTRNQPNAELRQEAFDFLLACMNGTRDAVFKTSSLKFLDRVQAEKIFNDYYGT